MKSIFKICAVLLVFFVIVLLLLINNPSLQLSLLRMTAPDHDFDRNKAIAPLDYSLEESWIALPSKNDNSDWVPAGEAALNAGELRAYVFFIHPTAYLGNQRWNGSVLKNTATEENKQWMMANQASVYNACCAVFAPYYREATIYAFIGETLDNGAQALNLAYLDVARAFQQFLRMIPEGSPFIVASHSQGTVHGQRLLQQEIDNTPLARRLVAAYLIGCTIHEELLEHYFKEVKACEGADDTACIVAWDTWREGAVVDAPGCPNWAGDRYVRNSEKWLCVNPLSWRFDENKVAKEDNPGSVAIQNQYNLAILLSDKPKGLQWAPLAAPVAGVASAQCQKGVLRSNDQSEGIFADIARTANYHGLDYALYYQSIRDNSQRRVQAWRTQNEKVY